MFVSSYFDLIKYRLSKSILHTRIRKWVLALTEYSLTCMLLKAMKGKIIADFIVEYVVVEMPQNYLKIKHWKLFFDGWRRKKGTGVGV